MFYKVAPLKLLPKKVDECQWHEARILWRLPLNLVTYVLHLFLRLSLKLIGYLFSMANTQV